MLHSRVWRRIAPLTLVVGFATFFPVRAHAATGGFESAWDRLFDFFGRKALIGLFSNAGIEMDPNGKPAPSSVTGGGTARPLQDSGTPSSPSGENAPQQ